MCALVCVRSLSTMADERGSEVYFPGAQLCGRSLGQESRCKCNRYCVNWKEVVVYYENLRCKLLCSKGPEPRRSKTLCKLAV